MAVGKKGLEGKGDWTGDWDGREGREGRVPSALAGDFDDAVGIWICVNQTATARRYSSGQSVHLRCAILVLGGGRVGPGNARRLAIECAKKKAKEGPMH